MTSENRKIYWQSIYFFERGIIYMNKKQKSFDMNLVIIIGMSSLILGFILGMFTYHLIMGSDNSGPTQSGGGAPPATFAAPAPATPPGQSLAKFNAQLKELKTILEADPKNAKAWATMGNIYFDSNRPNESIEAYSKALALSPGNPNVMTDRGVMYRRIGDFTKAVEDFTNASNSDSNHFQSLINLGVVYVNDLNQPEKARIALEKALAIPRLPANVKAQITEQMNQL
jgi:hypothetical protein